MKLIDQLREDLARISVIVRDHPDGIVVPAASDRGFDVSILFQDGFYHVGFEGLGLDSFDVSEASIAAQLFADCLSDKTRLVVVARGGKDVSWTLEEMHAETWTKIAHISSFITPFWRSKNVRFLQNHINLLGPNNSFKPTPLRGAA